MKEHSLMTNRSTKVHVDDAQQGHISRVEGKGSMSKGDNYIVVEAAKTFRHRTLDRL